MNKVAVVTGASGFLGSHFSEYLQRDGFIVYGLDISEAQQRNSNTYHHFLVDITQEASVGHAFNEIVENHQQIDVLVNNAGIDFKVDSASVMNKVDFRFENFDHTSIIQEFQVGILGALHCSKYALRAMIPRKSGNIITIASDLAIISPNQSIYHLNENLPQDFFKPISYSIIKHGQIGLTKYLATYCAPFKIRANCISPGPVYHNQPEAFLEKLNKQIPLGRLATPDEVAEALIFLASTKSNYLTGHNLVVDGGRTIW